MGSFSIWHWAIVEDDTATAEPKTISSDISERTKDTAKDKVVG